MWPETQAFYTHTHVYQVQQRPQNTVSDLWRLLRTVLSAQCQALLTWMVLIGQGIAMHTRTFERWQGFISKGFTTIRDPALGEDSTGFC